MKENCNDKNSISAEESISKIKTYSMFDLIKYILICTVGSGLLYVPKVMVAESKKNTIIESNITEIIDPNRPRLAIKPPKKREPKDSLILH